MSRAAGAALFAACLALVLLLLHPRLDQPPVWDTTSGLFPAAIVLAESGFDLGELLARPGWAQGGPNIHPFSAVTWLTAAFLFALEDPLWRPALHGVHFALGALTLLGAFRLGAPLLGARAALAASATLLLFPLFQVQVGYLYTEIPLACCTVWAADATVRRRFVAATLWSALACSVKEAGVLVPIAVAAAALLDRVPPAVRVRRVAALAVAPALFVTLQLLVSLPVEAAPGHRVPPYADVLVDVGRKLAHLPDLIGLLVLYAASVATALPGVRAGLREPDAAAADRVRGVGLLFVGAFAGFYLLVPLSGAEVYVLPRYYVQIAPLLLLGSTDLGARLGGPRLAAGFLVALALLFAANREGDLPGFYPPVTGNEFSLAERSFEYRELLAAQRALVDAALALPADLAVFYGLPEHFLFAYPRMGYAPGPPPRGRCLWLDRRRHRPRLADFPERFALLYNFAGYGGVPMQALLRQARRDPDTRVRSRVFRRGRYRTVLFEVSPRGPAPEAGPSRQTPPDS